jgi:hypothetical protein
MASSSAGGDWRTKKAEGREGWVVQRETAQPPPSCLRVEVHQQPGRDARQPEVADDLGFVNRQQALDGFHLDDELGALRLAQLGEQRTDIALLGIRAR